MHRLVVLLYSYVSSTGSSTASSTASSAAVRVVYLDEFETILFAYVHVIAHSACYARNVEDGSYAGTPATDNRPTSRPPGEVGRLPGLITTTLYSTRILTLRRTGWQSATTDTIKSGCHDVHLQRTYALLEKVPSTAGDFLARTFWTQKAVCYLTSNEVRDTTRDCG